MAGYVADTRLWERVTDWAYGEFVTQGAGLGTLVVFGGGGSWGGIVDGWGVRAKESGRKRVMAWSKMLVMWGSVRVRCDGDGDGYSGV